MFSTLTAVWHASLPIELSHARRLYVLHSMLHGFNLQSSIVNTRKKALAVLGMLVVTIASQLYSWPDPQGSGCLLRPSWCPPAGVPAGVHCAPNLLPSPSPLPPPSRHEPPWFRTPLHQPPVHHPLAPRTQEIPLHLPPYSSPPPPPRPLLPPPPPPPPPPAP